MAEQEARPYLQRVRESLVNGRIQINMHIAASPAAESIIDEADKRQLDLIVMSSHGCSGIERWTFGSVTEKTLCGAHCATRVVR